jgi:RNA polymerase-binding transcription factor DksA
MRHKKSHIDIFNRLVLRKSSSLNSLLQEKLDILRLYYNDHIDTITQNMLERMMIDTIVNLYEENKKMRNELRELHGLKN